MLTYIRIHVYIYIQCSKCKSTSGVMLLRLKLLFKNIKLLLVHLFLMSCFNSSLKLGGIKLNFKIKLTCNVKYLHEN